VRLLPWVAASLGAALIVVKSKRLCAEADAFLAGQGGSGSWSGSGSGVEPPSSFWGRVRAAEAKEGIVGRSKERRGGAPLAARYPLKLPLRRSKLGVEICRFHNYSQAGCIRGEQGRCPLEHGVCHWCGEPGHIALQCEAEIVENLDAKGEEDEELKMEVEPTPFLYALGGRLRGRTLVSCERLNLSYQGAAWRPVRALSEHRGCEFLEYES